MNVTNIYESGLEASIVNSLIEDSGYQKGNPQDYDRHHAVDWLKLSAFLLCTQPQLFAAMNLAEDGSSRTGGR